MVVYEVVGALVVLGLIILGVKWAMENIRLKSTDDKKD